MEKQPPPWTLAQVAEALGAELCGPGDFVVKRLVGAGQQDHEALGFAEDAKHLKIAETVGVGALLVPPDLTPDSTPYLRCDNPRGAFFTLLQWAATQTALAPGIDRQAWVHPDATVDPTARIGPFAVVERDAVIAANCRVYPLAYVGERCRLGAGTVVLSHAVLTQDVDLGEDCLVHPGAVLGAEGFGFFWDGSRHVKIPQVGGVALGDRVEIGALAAVDRATAGNTSIGDGSKIDNLVQVAHNVRIGRDTVIAGQCGLPGSVVVGDRVTIGGSVVINDHVRVCDDVTLGGRSGVARDIKEPGMYFGQPARKAKEGLRQMLAQEKVPGLLAKVRELEKRIAELESK